MTWLLIAALLALLLALLYFGAGSWSWILSGAAGLTVWAFALYNRDSWDSFWSPRDGEQLVFWICAIAYLAAFALLGPTPLRSALVGPLAYKLVAPILPKMSETERVALEAGTVWFDRQLFSGAPDWRTLLDFHAKPLTPEERAFLDGPCEEVCRMAIDHEVVQHGDLPPQLWAALKRHGFFGMIIPKEYGGLGFSAIAHSAVVTKLSSRCATLAVTVMVPNSLGPAELLLHYGTDEQKQHYLPRLARGEDIPCFALTEPGAGSDAGGMQSHGIVCKGQWQGREVLGIRLNWNKRYITLSSVATVIGLAFQLRDPERLLGGEAALGITCALIPANLPGIEIGERHDPLGIPFHNGPTRGKDVFVPLECIIGGRKMAGQGWRMLMQSLAAGRGISLPSLSVGATELVLRTTSAYASVREQFGLPIGKFEGIEEPLARIGGLCYALDAARRLTAGAIDAGEKPSVISAIVKRWMTESMRVALNDGMDIVGGAGISRGPRNVLASPYMATPIGITVEGANILTRSMIVFGQGAIRCHPHAQREIELAAAHDVNGFQHEFFAHVGFVCRNAARSLVLGLTRGAFSSAPIGGIAGTYLKRLTMLSASFAFVSDVAMGTLGGDLKRHEKITGRLSDCLAWMYLASASIKRFVDEGSPERDLPYLRWSVEHALERAQEGLRGALQNFPLRPVALSVGWIALPPGARLAGPSDRLGARVARGVLDDAPARDALTRDIYRPAQDEAGLGQLERALGAAVRAREPERKIKDAIKARTLARGAGAAEAEAAGVLTPAERERIEVAERERWNAVQVDAFQPDAYRALRG